VAREIRTHLGDAECSPLIHAIDEEAGGSGSPEVYVVTWCLTGEVVLRFQTGAQPTPAAGLTNEALLAIVADRLSRCTLPSVNEDRALREIRRAIALLSDPGPPALDRGASSGSAPGAGVECG
jgi:hypothetical protein